MASRKQILGSIVIALLCAGVIGAVTPFFLSLSPSAKAKAEVPTFNMSDVPIGSLQLIDRGDFSLVIARPSSDRFAIFEAMHVDNIARPYYMIWPGHIECHTFQLTTEGIACEGFYNEPSVGWRFDGTPMSDAPDWLPAIELMPYSILGDTVRFGAGA